MKDHSLRNTLNDELHERAGLPISAPCAITHLAFKVNETDEAPTIAIRNLARALGISEPPPGSLHHWIEVSEFVMRYERHREFYRIAIVSTKALPKGGSASDLLPTSWLENLPGERLVAVNTDVLRRTKASVSPGTLEARFGHQDLAGASVSHGKAFVWTDFRIGEDGYTKIVVQDNGLSPHRLGRVVRRIHEIETYRMMSLLALPLARETRQHIGKMELVLSDLVEEISSAKDARSDALCLQKLVKLSSEVERLANATTYRFAAARAYSEIVKQRVDELAEVRDREFQRIGLFLRRRFDPAIATCVSVEEQLLSLARRTERASNLLRTRVDIAMESQNQELLTSMNQRSRLQLRLQETVEGLSVVAISYYAWSLLAKFVESAAKTLAGADASKASLILIPLVVAVVWYLVKLARQRLV